MDKKKLDTITRLGIIASVFLIAFSIFYYLVIYIPGKERQKVEDQKQEELQKKKVEDDKKLQLDTCLIRADTQYSDNWNNECKSQGKLSASCIKLLDMTYEDYKKENNIPKDDSLAKLTEFFDKRDECSCRLPLDNSDRIDGRKKDAKAECYRKYQ